jgi:hypothetical protein
MEDICCFKERSESKITPRFLHEVEGVRLLSQKLMDESEEESIIFERC